MSFLPYNATPIGSWLAAASGSVVAHVAAVALVVGMVHSNANAPDKPAFNPDFSITLEPLDTDILIGIKETIGEPGQDPDNPENPDTSVNPDNPGANPSDEPETLPSEPAEPLESQSTTQDPEPVQPDLPEEQPQSDPTPPPDPVVPETAANDPEVSNPLPPQPTSPDRTEQPPVVFFDNNPTLTTGTLITDTSSGFDGGPGVQSQIAMANPTPAPTLPTAPDEALPLTPQTSPAPPPGQQDLALGDLIRRIRAAPLTPCLASLPRRAGDGGVGLALISAEPQDMIAFSKELLTDYSEHVRQTRTLIDPRQCPALSYVTNNKDYPASRLGVRLDSPAVPSGGRLSGVVRGVAGKSVLIMVIDADGVVQDLDKFTTINGNFARFEVPVTRTGPERDTSQLLVIIATPQPATTLKARMGQLARDAFAGLDGVNDAGAAMAVTTFDVR